MKHVVPLILTLVFLVFTTGCSISFLGRCPDNQTSFEGDCCDDFNGNRQCDAFEGACDDGIRNRDEEGIDCGGEHCPPCSAITCRYNLDCGADSTGPVYCNKNNIVQDVVEHECLNPGKPSSDCREKSYTKTIKECSGDEKCLDGSPTCMTSDLISASCHNARRDPWEENIDCGGPCRPCHNCTNKVKDGLEDGVDCGGPSCPPCPSCDDGLLNQDEENIDCGGTRCPPCPTCSDGVMNGKEEGIDCGGPCPPCYPECFNGVKDPIEEGVDCGGPCKPCPNCNDGVKNGLEKGVDCGGDCPPCPYDCYIDQDCGFDHQTYDSCINNSIYYNFVSYKCVNPGTPNATCLVNKTNEFVKRCADQFETCLVTDYCSEMGDCTHEVVEARCILNDFICTWIWCEEGTSYSARGEVWQSVNSPTTLPMGEDPNVRGGSNLIR